MTVSALVEGQLIDGERDGFTEMCREAFKVTRDSVSYTHLTLPTIYSV